MKKSELLNAPLSSVIAEMGHTDSLAIGDCGLPIPPETRRIDLALKKGVPSFLDTLAVVLTELCVEKVVMATEINEVSPALHEQILSMLGDTVTVEYVPHEQFKLKTRACKAVVRTGECTSYANIILYSGVTF